jgi:hypothetical protein
MTLDEAPQNDCEFAQTKLMARSRLQIRFLLIDLLKKSLGTPVRAIESSTLATHMQLRLAREP